jgi:Ras-related protein Rab-2A
MKRLTSGEFKSEHDVTVGVEFTGYDIKVEDKIIRLQIWDTAGQESFRSVTKIFYRNAHAVVLGYSIGDRSSFDHLTDWLNEIHASCEPSCLTLLSGCKADLPANLRQVRNEQALKF